LWQCDWLEPSCDRFIFMGCSSSDQLSGRGKIPDLAGRSIFCGRMAKRKSSRALLRNMTRLSGLLIMSTLRRGREIRKANHPKRPRDPNQLTKSIYRRGTHARNSRTHRRPSQSRGGAIGAPIDPEAQPAANGLTCQTAATLKRQGRGPVGSAPSLAKLRWILV
jgi:hypothetical protein